MRYAVFGPYDFKESIAISTCYPTEIIFWKNRTHLEDAGCDALALEFVKDVNGRSHHFGGSISTVTYKGAEMVLCQIDNVGGIYICSEKTAPVFSRGLSKLVDEKLDAKSEIRVELEKGWKELDDAIITSYGVDLTDVLEIKELMRSQDSESVLASLKSKSHPRYVSEKNLFGVIEGFYPSGVAGRSVHIGTALRYFGLPTKYLIEPAIKEELEICRVHRPDDCALLEKYLRENPEENLFGEE